MTRSIFLSCMVLTCLGVCTASEALGCPVGSEGTCKGSETIDNEVLLQARARVDDNQWLPVADVVCPPGTHAFQEQGYTMCCQNPATSMSECAGPMGNNPGKYNNKPVCHPNFGTSLYFPRNTYHGRGIPTCPTDWYRQNSPFASGMGVKGTAACPAGATLIESEDDCKAAASSLAFKFYDARSRTDWPYGCIAYGTSGLYFNTNTEAEGVAQASFTPVCTPGGGGGGSGGGSSGEVCPAEAELNGVCCKDKDGGNMSPVEVGGNTVCCQNQVSSFAECVGPLRNNPGSYNRKPVCSPNFGTRLWFPQNTYHGQEIPTCSRTWYRENSPYFSGMGQKGSADCPDGKSAITSEDDCKAAAASLAFKFYDARSRTDYPYGCAAYGTSGVYFNTNTEGVTQAAFTRICN